MASPLAFSLLARFHTHEASSRSKCGDFGYVKVFTNKRKIVFLFSVPYKVTPLKLPGHEQRLCHRCDATHDEKVVNISIGHEIGPTEGPAAC